MRKVDLKEQKRVSGGTHWHWKCSVTPYIEYSCAVTPQIRQAGNRLSGLAETAYASLLA